MERKNFKKDLSVFCDKDEFKPCLDYVFFKDGFVIASDGNCLVRQKLSLHGFTPKECWDLNNCGVHMSVFKQIYSYRRVEFIDNMFVCFDKVGGEGRKFNVIPDGEGGLRQRYPDAESVIPSDEDLMFVFCINFDKRLMSKALNVTLSKKIVTFGFCGEEGPLMLKSEDLKLNEECIVVMPYKVTNK